MRKPFLSQHFLRNPSLALKLIGHSNIKKRDTVLEIGAGSGVITTALAKRCSRVLSFELDPETVQKLKHNLRQIPQVEIYAQDFLEFDLTTIAEPYKVFSNPPFHLSSEIIRKLIRSPHPPESIYLILQKQLALKLIPTERHYTSQLGHELISLYETKIKLPLRPQDFTPPPGVPTVLFEAKRRTLI